MSKFRNSTAVYNISACFLMLILFTLQCLPFWLCKGGETFSIQGYIWFIDGTLTRYISEQLGVGFIVDEILTMPILTIIFAFGGTALLFKYPCKSFISFLAIACGIVGIWGYTSHPAFSLGMDGIKIKHLILCAAILVMGIISLVSSVGRKYK